VSKQLEELGRLAASEVRLRKITPASAWSVLQHVEHLVLASDVMIARIEESLRLPTDEHKTTGKPRPIGRIVLALGKIPRGRSQAPSFTVPEGAGVDELRNRVRDLQERVDQLAPRLDDVLVSRHRSSHPILGDFTPSQWLRFLDIHLQHHLNIIQDIERG
jgi:hypothetical protein